MTIAQGDLYSVAQLLKKGKAGFSPHAYEALFPRAVNKLQYEIPTFTLTNLGNVPWLDPATAL